MSIKILIADDDSLIRESLKIILNMDEDFEVISCTENGFEAVEECKERKIDVALLDVRMPVMNGVEATREIVKQTDTKVLILTTFDEDKYIKEAIKNGAKGYLLKDNSPIKIKDAIRTIYNGNTVLQDVVLDKLRDGISNKVNKVLNTEAFTPRELEIIESIAQGLSNKEISKKLFISEGTVKNYITSILSKTNLKHRTQIAIMFIKGEIVT
ncbi:response regulator transcription factor [Clostridiaceae bacterium M8S5]|nr:response regulator transcription factor [Clostridiaceae bacterium M8S5]